MQGLELRELKKGMDERIDESVLRWFGHSEKMENTMTHKRAYEV